MSAEGAAPPGPMPRGVRVVAVVAFIVALGFGIVVPAISLLADGFGVGKTAVGTAVSAFAFARFVSGPLGGRLLERWGERPVLVAGLLTVAVTSGTAGFAPEFWIFVLLRGIGGVGSALFTVAAVSLVLRLALPHQRGRATATVQTGFLLGGMVGPGLGGFLTDVATWLPFVIYGGALLVAAAVAAGALPAPVLEAPAAGPAATGVRERVLAARRLVGHPVFVVVLLANLGVGWTVFGLRNSLLTLYVVDLGGTAAVAGGVLVAGALAQALALRWAGRVADERGRRPAMVMGASIAGVALAVLVVPAAGVAGLALAAAAMAVFGVGAAFLSSAPAAALGDIGRTGQRVAVFQMASDAGAIAGPLLAGAAADLSGYGAAFGLSAAVLLLVAVAAARMPETLLRSEAGGPDEPRQDRREASAGP